MDFFLIKFLTVLVIAAIVAILPLVFIAFISQKKSNRKLRYVLISLLSILELWIFYSVYIAFYPNESFYFEEYKNVVGKLAPKSAEIIDKSASYPDFQGSYNSVSLIRLSETDYCNLYKEIDQSKDFEQADLVHTETLNELLDSNKNIKEIIWKGHKNQNEGWQHHFIGFVNNQKDIIICYVSI
ncbi:hypothetical protein DBR40_10145 [Pedobacter sp. KBW01]|uniref:hypothetical protein n=1 Tax=Pedobacter sp. KBW01 TaxID=2153364 RepID=UPI000F59B3A2|nr:hypothetical protein [Pedobacter sp. KBW01]RQO77024.1 hypothetical protein DBR40_10145 [Pedobacter sp. KBW01]